MEVKIHAEPIEKGKEEPSKWEIECWARTLIDAEEIKGDAEKMKLVGPYLQAKKDAIGRVPVRSLKELKSRKSELDKEDED